MFVIWKKKNKRKNYFHVTQRLISCVPKKIFPTVLQMCVAFLRQANAIYDTKKQNGSLKQSRFIFLRRCVTRRAVEKQPLA